MTPPDTPSTCEGGTTLPQPAPVYELVYNIGATGEQKAGGDMSSVISIQLAEDWHTPVLIPDSCLVSELAGLRKPVMFPGRGATPDLLSVESLYPELHLTDEEKRLLSQEGIALPNNLPRSLRVAACSVQNQDLHKKVLELEKHNISLITQLRKLQTADQADGKQSCPDGHLRRDSLLLPGITDLPQTTTRIRSGDTPKDGVTYRPTGVNL
ncbi:unnamed protein product [Ranitomeya imitator]|uniref:Uncharacterized protein n=1 Tax=Ranitomeya imitator TaxID=111125 RepID=A0ABN9LVM2_9NEOB|nr:unnamed protein product [Ranitomeya imitator]